MDVYFGWSGQVSIFVFPENVYCLLDCDPIQMNGTTCINLSSYCTFLEWVHTWTCTVYCDVQGGSDFWVSE